MWRRLFLIVLALPLLLGTNTTSQTDGKTLIEDGEEDSCVLCDLTSIRIEDLTQILSNLIRPLESAVATFFSEAENELDVSKGLRVIVFSPHPDDETLAAGGLVQRVVSLGGEVRMVFVTNGDGYPEAIRRQLGHPPRSSDDFKAYGTNRYEEALQAMCELGISPDDSIFLGFPDDGIDDLLKDHWSKFAPYTSPHTRFNCAGYKESYNRWTVYAGVNLKDEVARILEDFSPDWIVLPDPRDYHPDHCATGLFVLEAIRQLNQEGKILFGNTQILTYLVHFKDYPTAPAWMEEARRSGFFMSTSGCGILSSTEWLNLPLLDEELEGKERALSAYQSQQSMLGGFFRIFLDSEEIFGRLDPAQALAIPQDYSLNFKQPRS
jgi:LmbE family N-acetylglucosaminyl deacetylase